MQKSYNYHTPKGVAGGPMDIAPHSIDSRINGETDDGAMLFGMGVVQGGSPGLDVGSGDGGNGGAVRGRRYDRIHPADGFERSR